MSREHNRCYASLNAISTPCMFQAENTRLRFFPRPPAASRRRDFVLVRHEPNLNLKWSSGGAAAAAVTFLPSSLAGVAALSHALIATPLLPAHPPAHPPARRVVCSSPSPLPSLHLLRGRDRRRRGREETIRRDEIVCSPAAPPARILG